jgi:hypothetical protein
MKTIQGRPRPSYREVSTPSGAVGRLRGTGCSSTNRRTGRGRAKAVTLLGAVAVLLGAANLGAQSIGWPEATPKVVVAGTPTPVTVSSSITAVASNVVVQQVDTTGNVVQSQPMTTTGGGLYSGSIQVTVPKPAGGTAILRVAATIQGITGQQVSQSVVISSVAEFFPTNIDPNNIAEFLDELNITSAPQFLQYLDPANFQKDWILMTASASTQSSTATQPRVIIQSKASDQVFGFELDHAKSTGGTDKNTIIEYIQWDNAMKKFRFHEINLTTKQVSVDKGSCARCHSTGLQADGNGEGPSWPYPRPNWDAYDSWGGALPYNRDRIYKGVEALAMQALLKAPIADPILKQLDLPSGMTRDGAGNVMIPIAANASIASPDTPPAPPAPQTQPWQVAYLKNGGVPTYPGGIAWDTIYPVTQGGDFFLMASSDPNVNPAADGGRGVAMFDHFSAFNAVRVAQELVDSVGKTAKDSKGKPVDIRYAALAIATGCLTPANLATYAPAKAITYLQSHLPDPSNSKNLLPVLNPAALLTDTGNRQHQLPQMKANQEAPNVQGLLNMYGGGSSAMTITDVVARRSQQPPIGALDTLTAFTNPKVGGMNYQGFMIDREFYTRNNETQTIALFRLFLEPMGEPVNKWTMSIKGNNIVNGKQVGPTGSLDHSGTYTFADVFNNVYIPQITTALAGALGIAPAPTAANCGNLPADSSAAYANVGN